MPVQENLWPSFDSVTLPSEPAAILSEQGEALGEVSEGQLSGLVEESELTAEEGVTYDFFIQVTDKPYHYLLLSIQHPMRTDYPVRISNTLAGTITQAHDAETFKKQLSLIFHAPATIQLLERMKAFAGQTAS